jgi:FkbM family methyltransferase
MKINIPLLISKLPKFLRRHKVVKLLLLISPESKYQKVFFNGNARLYADLSDPNPRNYLVTGSFLPDFFRLAIPFLSNGGTFFDVGANWGFCSFGITSHFQNRSDFQLKLHLFEANPNLCHSLKQSASLYPEFHISINNCCITNKAGLSKLKICEQQTGESYISQNGTQPVKNIILDEYIQSNKIQKVNFMKMDIEGWEPLAALGCSSAFKAGIVDAIYTEFVESHLMRSGYTLRSYCELLTYFGFCVFYYVPCKENHRGRENVHFLNINGAQIPVEPINIDSVRAEYTDILAIHRKSHYMPNI